MGLIKLIKAFSFLCVFLCSSNMIKFNAACNSKEREALINFKHHLKDPYHVLSSWVVGSNCCKWNGVICQNKSEGDVMKLQLGFSSLSGEPNSSLVELKHLYHLDLGWNNFKGRQIPAFLGSLQNLQYLDLHGNGFTGKVPPQLGNLSSLYYLYLRSNSFTGNVPPQLGNLSRLHFLDLSNNGFTGKVPPQLGNLSRLHFLDLSDNGFTGKVPPQLGNLLSLYYLDLSANELEGEIPRTFGNLCNLERLVLSINKLQGEISSLFTNSSRCFAGKMLVLRLDYNLLSGQLPDELGTLKNLEDLSLRGNSFSGPIPMTLGRLSSLEILDLRESKFNGSLPESFGNLSSLQQLYMTLEGFLTEINLINLTRLRILDISSMVLNVSRDWVPPFQLQKARLQNCSVGRFPEWLQTQKNLTTLDVSNAGISGSVPSWFWNMTSQLDYLNISHNQLEGELPNMFSMSGGESVVYMKSNRFTGNLPRIASPIFALDLSKNTFSGPISNLLCYSVTFSLILLDLSENHLSGELSDCWFYWWRSLEFLYLQSNNITGKIPSSIGFLYQLETLRLQNNSLSGEFPSSLRNCSRLRIIDVGENRLTGRIPSWLGESLARLTVLRLRSNEFNGEIPRKLCYLTKLQIMDLGHTNLFGSIPKCFSNFSTMASKRHTNYDAFPMYDFQNTEDTVDFVVKGKDMIYGQSLLPLIAAIDLSSNNLYGEIPEELTYLYALQILNLGKNRFTGKIPKKIGLLSSLESLDLSNNELSGSIPQTMVNLTFLGYLNLSYNNLSGEIPSGTQLQSFSELSYIGNHDLCGRPLENCNKDEQQPRKAPYGDGGRSMEADEDWIEMKWFYMGIPFGFVVGFWCLFGVLIVNKSWRYAYLRFLDDIIYSLCTCLKQKKK